MAEQESRRLLLAGTASGASTANATETPHTLRDKFERLKDEGFFREPRDSGAVVTALRDRGWGVYVSKNVSSALKRYGSKIALRRVPMGKGRYAYAHP